MRHAGAVDVLHCQQTLNAFGSLVVFKWLSLPSTAARIVTVHELDPNQIDYPGINRAYNPADAILVHTTELRDQLMALGVDAGRIELVRHGVELQPPTAGPREGIMFYGGYHLNAGNGLDTLCQVLALVRARLGPRTPTLKVHGYDGDGVRGDAAMLEYGRRCAMEAGVADLVTWLNRLDSARTLEAYRRSLLCVIPFTSSFAGLPASLALANDVPVIGTLCAGLPEHLGEAGIYVRERAPGELADAIVRVVEDGALRTGLARAGRRREEALLSGDAVATVTLDVCRRALEGRGARSAG